MGKNNKLKATRIEHGFTQKDMADYLGISNVAYSNKETGKSDFRQSEINKILDLFPNKKYEDVFLMKGTRKRNKKSIKPAQTKAG